MLVAPRQDKHHAGIAEALGLGNKHRHGARGSAPASNRFCTCSSASWPIDFLTRRACSRNSASFEGSIVVVMRIRRGRPSFGRPSARGSGLAAVCAGGSLLAVTRGEPIGALIQNLRQGHIVLGEQFARALRDQCLHVHANFSADRWPPD